jgi:hypothetical protein
LADGPAGWKPAAPIRGAHDAGWRRRA